MNALFKIARKTHFTILMAIIANAGCQAEGSLAFVELFEPFPRVDYFYKSKIMIQFIKCNSLN